MKIIINGNEFPNTTWSPDIGKRVAVASIQTEESVYNIIQLFGDGNDIEVYDDEDVLISTWRNLGLIAINEIQQDPRTVQASFKISIIDDSAEAALQSAIDDGIGGIMELAELYAEIQENVDSLKEDGKTAKADISNLKEDMTIIKNRIDSVPSDIIERFSALWNSYNALADRVAKLENK